MNENIQRQLVRQLKIINFWISFYGIIMILIMGFLVYMLFQVMTFIQHTNDQLQQFKTTASDTVNVQKQACDNGTVGDWLKKNTSYCQ